ncbi:MAG: phosphate ABC transporter substrate-binding/OmpA family protein [Desulfomonilaceae bacterium]|nr:phosphate ABC transporter substrate-binding/OmpA family protein [Desulfomonilaceae bacterium]
MNKRIVGALILLVLGIIAIVGAWYLLPYFQDAKQRATSDAGRTKGKITVALDNWIGYFILRSPEMKKLMHRSGWVLATEDDDADYPARMARLKAGEIDFAVATVDSYILNAAGLGFPGTIIMVVDESKGGDAILARKDEAANLDALKGRSDARIAFTPGSPSHHLAKAAAYHFSVPELLPRDDDYRIETRGSADALNRLLAGTTDVAIMWEPDVSRALAHPGIIKLLGTEDTEKLIVDVLIVHRKYSEKNPGAVKTLLANYFRALKKYQEAPQQLREQVKAETGLTEHAVDSMLKGVKWVNLTQNCEQWFGISPPGGASEDGLVSAVESAVKVLMNAGDFSRDPLPGGDPYRLTYSRYLEELFLTGVTGFTSPADEQRSGSFVKQEKATFSPLTDEQWNRLTEVGKLKLDPVMFQHGSSDLDMLGKEVLDKAVQLFAHYPNFRLIVKGHTGTKGDPEENQRLSLERAGAVTRYLSVTHSIDPNRMRAVGLGGTEPLPKKDDELLRSWQYRLPRVELVLVREEY